MSKVDRVDEFVSLYVQHSRRVYGFIRSLVSNQSDAEDVFQDVGRTLWEKFGEFRAGSNFPTWAFAISHFKVLQYRRSRARMPVSLSDSVFELIAEDMLKASTHEDQLSQVLAECMGKLPARDRELIETRYRRGQTTKSVAETAGRSADSIYRALRRIHKALLVCMQRSLAEEGIV